MTHKSPTNILYVDHALGLGGAELSLLGLLGNLDRRRFRPVLAARPGPLADAAEALDVPVRRVHLPRLKRSLAAPWDLARGALALARVARTEDAALIHGNVLRAAVYCAAAGGLVRRPFVWHVRDILSPGPVTWGLCRSARAVIAISNAVATPLACRNQVHVIHNPVAAPAPRGRSRSDLGLPETGVLIASVGRLRRWKGHHRFLRAAGQVAVRHPGARFLVVGGRIFTEDDRDADYPAALRALAEELDLADRTTFTGHRDDLADLWPHLDLLVHAADAEPFGRVVAEAQRAGVPVAAFADGGVPEIVEDGRTGLLVPAGDEAALAAAIDRLLGDPEMRDRMGRAAIDAGERFDPEAHARQVEAVYAQVLGHGPIGSHR